jgi:hypothetical protein
MRRADGSVHIVEYADPPQLVHVTRELAATADPEHLEVQQHAHGLVLVFRGTEEDGTAQRLTYRVVGERLTLDDLVDAEQQVLVCHLVRQP